MTLFQGSIPFAVEGAVARQVALTEPVSTHAGV